MPLYPPASNAFEPYGPHLVTGNSQTFEASNGSWTETGSGTLLWTDTGSVPGAFHPINTVSTHVLDFTASGSGDLVELVVPGTFRQGQPYVAMLAVTEQTGDTAIWELQFGIDSVDTETSNQRFYPGLFANVHLASVVWYPTADRTNPSIILRYIGAATPQVWVGWCQVNEIRDYPVFRDGEVTSGRGSWARQQDLHYTLVNEDFLVQAVDVIRMNSGEEITMTVAEGDIGFTASDGSVFVTGNQHVEMVATTGNIDIASSAGAVSFSASSTFGVGAGTGILLGAEGAQYIALYDGGPGLAANARPTIDPTAETGTLQAVVEALIALGVVIDGTP